MQLMEWWSGEVNFDCSCYALSREKTSDDRLLLLLSDLGSSLLRHRPLPDLPLKEEEAPPRPLGLGERAKSFTREATRWDSRENVLNDGEERFDVNGERNGQRYYEVLLLKLHFRRFFRPPARGSSALRRPLRLSGRG